MKYIINDETRGDCFNKEFDTLEEAVSTAKADWEHKSASDKKHCSAFYVLESVNPDEEAEDHFDGNVIWEANKMFVIRDREAGNVIETVETLTEAQAILAGYEAEDQADGTYTEDFYEIVAVEAK